MTTLVRNFIYAALFPLATKIGGCLALPCIVLASGCAVAGHRVMTIQAFGMTFSYEDQAMADKNGDAQAYRAGFDDESSLARLVVGGLFDGPPEPEAVGTIAEAVDSGDADGG